MKLSHEVMLALAYVSQISDPDAVKRRFIESMNALDDMFSFQYTDRLPSGIPQNRVMPITTLRSSFGYAVMAENVAVSAAEEGVFRSAFTFLAILLENRMQALALESRNESLLKEIQSEKSLVRTVLDTLPVGVWVMDEQGAILMGNPANEKIWAGTPYVGTDWWPDAGKQPERYEWGITRAIRNGETVTDQEIDIACSDGTHKTILHSAAPLLNEENRVIGAIGIHQDISSRKQAEDAIRISEERLKFVLDGSQLGYWDWNIETDEVIRNEQWAAMLGFTLEEIESSVNQWTDLQHPDDRAAAAQSIQDHLKGLSPEHKIEYRMRTKDGGYKWILDQAKIVSRDSQGKPLRMSGTHTDITPRKLAEAEREKLQAQLGQSQKMESVGRLAGGVAHDFNNMLNVIMGYAELAMDNMAPDNPIHSALQEILNAARRSADITRQLLAFARKQTIAPKVLDLNETVEGMLKMLRRLIGENIALAWLPESDIWPVRMDPSQLDQILANLCINARDAIADVGKITIETGKAVFDASYCADHPGFSPGEYVLLAVSDNGSGMTPETLKNLFEPFFTTKGVGKGTGLGLATVYGIVRQNSGFINVYSEPEKGTTFRIYLSRHRDDTKQFSRKGITTPDVRGSETILLVEDEPAILKMTTMMLERQGYTVLGADTPGKAFHLAHAHAGEIHLLMTDVIMPEMNGKDLAGHLRAIYPNLKCLFMSGYSANVIAHHGVLDEGVHFIQKPFSKQELTASVQKALHDYFAR
jgi:PAS domain S-box-containing protein